jgi:hypothetical protein
VVRGRVGVRVSVGKWSVVMVRVRVRIRDDVGCLGLELVKGDHAWFG